MPCQCFGFFQGHYSGHRLAKACRDYQLNQSQPSSGIGEDEKGMLLTRSMGEYVLVCLQPYHQLSLKFGFHHKIGQHFFGPFKIAQMVSSVAARLYLPPSSPIHLVFHVSRLTEQVSIVPDIAVHNELVQTPEAIIAAKMPFFNNIPSKSCSYSGVASIVMTQHGSGRGTFARSGRPLSKKFYVFLKCILLK